MRRLTLGTAGHIDHGKTALVRALTGVDTDRLPEEKRRGITIDLGFARLSFGDRLELGIVDVPGHEAFVRNMLAGATGIDLVLLVVAADEGVMPQTREHVAIVELLGITRGVVALTKADLVDDDWLELVRDDVAELLRGGPLRAAPLIPVSARTGQGLDELRAAIEAAATDTPERDGRDLFRMPIDRVFTVRGTGTVVTGTVWSGCLARDAQVRIEPAGFTARVRGLQRHGADCDAVGAGERAAIALAGVDRATLTRGDTLIAGAGAWPAARTLTVRLAALHDAAAPLRPRQRVRVSLGTAEVLARLALPGGELGPGGTTLAQLRLESLLMARAGDRFVLRSYSPVRTIAGGVVVEPLAGKRKRFTGPVAAACDVLARGSDPDARGDAALLRALLELSGPAGVPTAELPVVAGLPPHRIDAALADARHFAVSGGRMIATADVSQARARILAAIASHHADAPLDDGCDREALRRRAGAHARPAALPDLAFEAALQRLAASGDIVPRGSAFALPGHVPTPGPAQQAALERLAAHYAAAGLQAPDVDELPEPLATPDAQALLRHLERSGVLVRLGQNRWTDATALARGIAGVYAQLPVGTPLSVADFRDVLNLTRKHLIPLLEYFDRVGLTTRAGDSRTLAPPPQSATPLAPGQSA